MSKKLIAGAGVVASLAVALAPLATFAASVTTHTDTLKLTIPEVCTLGTVTDGQPDNASDATTHENGTGTWATTGTGTVAATGTDGRTDVLAATVYNGQAYATLGTTTFTVKCNDSDGYTLSAVSGEDDGEATPTATLVNGSYTIKSAATGTLTADNGSYWNFKVAVSNATDQTITSGYNVAHAVPADEAVAIVTGNGAGNTNTGDTITITYGAGIDAFQEAGTYEGSVIYTLAQLGD